MSAPIAARVLVPVFGGDISDATFARARAALDIPGGSVAIVHVMPPDGMVAPAPRNDGEVPRWQRLADAAPAFVDAVRGEPADVVLSQARRFGSDVVLLGRPGTDTPRAEWERDVVAPVRQGAPARLRVLGDRPVRTGNGRARRQARRTEATC